MEIRLISEKKSVKTIILSKVLMFCKKIQHFLHRIRDKVLRWTGKCGH